MFLHICLPLVLKWTLSIIFSSLTNKKLSLLLGSSYIAGIILYFFFLDNFNSVMKNALLTCFWILSGGLYDIILLTSADFCGVPLCALALLLPWFSWKHCHDGSTLALVYFTCGIIVSFWWRTHLYLLVAILVIAVSWIFSRHKSQRDLSKRAMLHYW